MSVNGVGVGEFLGAEGTLIFQFKISTVVYSFLLAGLCHFLIVTLLYTDRVAACGFKAFQESSL